MSKFSTANETKLLEIEKYLEQNAFLGGDLPS